MTYQQNREELFQFGFFIKPENLLKEFKVNDLIKKYLELYPELNGPLYIGFHDKIVTKMVLFEGKISKAIIVQDVRSSYHDKLESAVLYEITFSEIPELKIFRVVDHELRFIFIEKMALIQKDEYQAQKGTPLEITMRLCQTETQVALTIFDHFHHPLIDLTSAHLIENPVDRFKSYLDYFVHCKNEESIKMLEIYLPDLIEEIKGKDYSKLIDPLSLQALLELKFWVYQDGLSLEIKRFFEVLISKALSASYEEPSIEAEQINESTTLFFYPGQKKLRLIKKFEGLDASKIEEALWDLRLGLEKYPHSKKNVIEFYVGDKFQVVDEIIKKCKFQDLHLKELFFVFQKEFQFQYSTFRFDPKSKLLPCQPLHHLHPALENLFELSRFDQFNLEEVPEFPFIFIATAKKMFGKMKDERLVGFSLLSPPHLEDGFRELLEKLKITLAHSEKKNFFYNRMNIHVTSFFSEKEFTKTIEALIEKYWFTLQAVNIEKVLFRFSSEKQPYVLEVKNILYKKPEFVLTPINDMDKKESIRVLSSMELRELQVLIKGGVWAYRIPALITSLAEEFRTKELGQKNGGPRIWDKAQQSFIELDLDYSKTVIDRKTGSIDYNYGELMEVDRPIGNNEAGIVLGIKTDNLGIGKPVKRILIIGDLSHSSKGAIRAQECARVNAAIRYAAKEKMPIDWFTASFGVQVHREKGVEGLDAAASTIREIVRNCHHKGVQINLVVDETNIGAQSYWDSMATILNETSGVLIMTPKGCMALTGPSALVSALFGTAHSEQIPQFTKNLYPKGLQSLSGYENIHGPNSDSMLFAHNIREACYVLLKHHYYSYIEPGEKLASARPQVLSDEIRDPVNIEAVHKEIDNFLKGLKPNREVILNYIKDKNSPQPLRLWSDIKGIKGQEFKNGDLPQTPSTIVKELLIGGFPTFLIFTATGPLTPLDAEVIARAIYKASGRMQVLIIGSLSGFSCDPLSMENRQLQAGSYIAKAIVDHEGPILIVNLGNLVGGTFVVFNKQLNPDVKILAIEGARVQVLGGKAAAKVVFHSQICKRADEDPRVLQYAKIENRNDPIHSVYQTVRNQVINEIEDKEAAAFDQVHNAQRAVKVGSIDQIISFDNLRGSIIVAFEEMRAKYLKQV